MHSHIPVYIQVSHTSIAPVFPGSSQGEGQGYSILDVIQAKGLGKNGEPSAEASHYHHQYHYYYPIYCWVLDLPGDDHKTA